MTLPLNNKKTSIQSAKSLKEKGMLTNDAYILLLEVVCENVEQELYNENERLRKA